LDRSVTGHGLASLVAGAVADVVVIGKLDPALVCVPQQLLLGVTLRVELALAHLARRERDAIGGPRRRPAPLVGELDGDPAGGAGLAGVGGGPRRIVPAVAGAVQVVEAGGASVSGHGFAPGGGSPPGTAGRCAWWAAAPRRRAAAPSSGARARCGTG